MQQNFQSSLFFQLTNIRDWYFCVLEFISSMAQKTFLVQQWNLVDIVLKLIAELL